MKILVNAIPLTGLLTGISRYVRQLYLEMEKFPGIEISYFDGKHVSRKMPDQADPDRWSKKIAMIWKLPAPVVFALRTMHWLKFETTLRHVCKRNKFDIYHETGFIPAAISTIPTIYNIYDLSLIEYRSTHPRERVWFYEFMNPRRLRFANHILTLSDFIRQEICSTFLLPASKVSAIPLAPANHFFPRSAEQIAKAAGKFKITGGYLIFVGSLEPRKNLPVLIQAIKRCKTDKPLLLVGWEGWGDKSWMQTIRESGLSQRIILSGYVDDENLACLYSGATALVYPSLYEGFGLPVLEAMACGCPVICSKTSSLPEVTGDAALLIDPQRPDELADAIDRVAADPSLRLSMAQKGQVQAGLFSWRETARKTLNVFETLVQ
ncbi:MAG: glycosyltransferase family 1 protein [Pseudomonadota bacterium]